MSKTEGDKNAIRSAYKSFMDGLGGRDLLEHLLTLEMTAHGEGAKGSMEEKAFAMVKINMCYSLRTYLDDMSKPAPATAVRSVSPK